jgi:sortase (surface protein transpeptidase)
VSLLQTPVRVTSPVNNISERDLLQRRNQSIEQTYQEMRSRSIQAQSRYIFEDLSILQRNIQNNLGGSKRSHLRQDHSNENMSRSDNIISPKKLNYAQGNSSKDTSTMPSVNNSFPNLRIPLRNIDLNSVIMENTGNNSYNKGIRRLEK